jgi:hypothetical protein
LRRRMSSSDVSGIVAIRRLLAAYIITYQR